MGQPLTTDNIGPYLTDAFVKAFNDVCLPAFNSITEDVETLKTGMSEVKDELKEVKKEMATKDDLSSLETRLNKRLKAINDVQDNLTERIESLESPFVTA